MAIGVGEPGAKAKGQTIGIVKDKDSGYQGPRWCDRSGSAPDGVLTIRAANRRLPDAYAAWLQAEEERRSRETEAALEPAVMFTAAGLSWLAEGKTVRGWKPTTVKNMERYLRMPDDKPARRGSKPTARIMREFGHASVTEIDTPWVKRFLRTLDSDEDLSPRSVNAYRGILLGIFAHAVDEGWCEENPVISVPKRREADPAEIVVYTPNQIEAIAAHASDVLLAVLIITAADTGLQLGELLALRWKQIDFVKGRLRGGRCSPLATARAACCRELGSGDRPARPESAGRLSWVAGVPGRVGDDPGEQLCWRCPQWVRDAREGPDRGVDFAAFDPTVLRLVHAGQLRHVGL